MFKKKWESPKVLKLQVVNINLEDKKECTKIKSA